MILRRACRWTSSRHLYDDPAKRPMILDVRAYETYMQGISRAQYSFPEADVDTRVRSLPKDKLIVAYCQ